MNFKKQAENNKGITLIALAITVIILLILAGITIGTLKENNGIIKETKGAKKVTEINNEKEIIELSTIQAMEADKKGNIKKEELEKSLKNNVGEGKTEIIEDDSNFVVKFIETNRYYKIDENGNTEQTEIIKDSKPGNIEIGINGEELDGKEKPFEIWCIEDLVEWSNNYMKYLTSNIKICINLNFKSELSYANPENTEYRDINGDGVIESLIQEMQKGKGFTPIGLFKGTCFGENHYIKNIYIDSEENAALIKETRDNTTIRDIEVYGKIKSKQEAAGLVAEKYSGNINIINCKNYATITASDSVGGLVGYTQEGSAILENCFNKGNVNGVSSVGGIIGSAFSNVTMYNCRNDGKIIGKHGVAGMIGVTLQKKVSIYNCLNTGKIISDIEGEENDTTNATTSNRFTASGFIGFRYYNTEIHIENCCGIGSIEGFNNRCGAIIGFNWMGDKEGGIKNCYYLKSDVKAEGNIIEDIDAHEFEKGEIEKVANSLNSYIDNNKEHTNMWRKWKVSNKRNNRI